MSKTTTQTKSPAKTERNEKIVQRRKDGETLTSIAKDMGLSVTRVSRIVNNFYERIPARGKKSNRVNRGHVAASA